MAQKLDGLEGIPDGGRVAMVEDVLTTGGSLRHGIEQARGAGLDVVGAVVLVRRLRGPLQPLPAEAVASKPESPESTGPDGEAGEAGQGGDT